MRSGRVLQAGDWPLSLLRGLRSGQLRIPILAIRSGQSFPQLRERLRALSSSQRAAVLDGLQSRLQQATSESKRSAFDAIDPHAVRECVQQRALPPHPQALLLQVAGRDRFGRQHWLQPVANSAWKLLREAAQSDGIVLELVSSFRSVRDQNRILLRKLRQGQALDAILRVNAPPGYSEHHSGCALDLAVPGEPLLTEAFEATPAFAWLVRHAPAFGFALSYPRDNRFGFIYEPWHWCYRGPSARNPQLSTTGP